MRIPFNKPHLTGRELEYITEAHANGQLAGDDPFIRKCHAWLEAQIGCHMALLTHSCTAALEMAAILGNIGEGDRVATDGRRFERPLPMDDALSQCESWWRRTTWASHGD